MKVDAMQAGSWGLMTAQESLSRHADTLSKIGVQGTDIVTPVVGVMTSTIQYKASSTVVRSADKMQRTLLDLLA